MRLPFALICILLGQVVQADWRAAESWDGDEPQPWREIEVALPAYPKTSALVPFEVSAATRNRHFLDTDSLSVGADGVVRYTVVIRTAGGAENVYFEGMRCDAGEVKRYAFGRPDGAGGGSWLTNRQARWEPLPARQAASHQRELFYHYLCTVEGRGDLKAIRRNLRAGGLYRDGGSGLH